MILRAPALVCPRKAYGWQRPIPEGGNYRLGGLLYAINGIAEKLPAGADIAPFLQASGNDDPNLMCVGVYVPPTRVTAKWHRGNNWSPANLSEAASALESDCTLKDEAGNNLHRINQGWGDQSGFELVGLGTTMLLEVVEQIFLYPGRRDTFEVTSMRGAVARIEAYEQGGDGIVNVAIDGSEATPAVATRVSDNTEQILSAGQIYLRPGKSKFSITCTTAINSWNEMAYILAVDFEIPYGL